MGGEVHPLRKRNECFFLLFLELRRPSSPGLDHREHARISVLPWRTCSLTAGATFPLSVSIIEKMPRTLLTPRNISSWSEGYHSLLELEDRAFQVGEYGCRLPCGHVYLEDELIQWLRNVDDLSANSCLSRLPRPDRAGPREGAVRRHAAGRGRRFLDPLCCFLND